MATKVKVELDRAGIGAVLRSTLRTLVNDAAHRVAANVKVASGVPVVMRPYTTDRAAASVTIQHRDGAAMQAKNGALTRAAAAAGLEVKRR